MAKSVAKPQVYRKIDVYTEKEQDCFRVLCDYFHILEKWKILYAPKTPNEDYDEKFVEASQRLGYIEYLIDFIIDEDIENRYEIVNGLITDGTISRLRERIDKIKEVEKYEQHK